MKRSLLAAIVISMMMIAACSGVSFGAQPAVLTVAQAAMFTPKPVAYLFLVRPLNVRAKEIVAFISEQIEPLPAIHPYGERYRVSATLTDGTHLPCVVVESASRLIDLAIRRFDETRNDKSLHRSVGYRAIVKTFVTRGNSVNDYNIQLLSISPFAIPLARGGEIGEETSMSWTEFYATMTDGTEFRFGTQFSTEFFDMPIGYVANDIQKIVPAIRSEEPRHDKIYREKPFFTCYIDEL